MLDPLFNNIKETVGKVARQRGYSVVLPKQSVIWNTDTADITDDVIKQLNSDNSVSPSAPIP